MQGEKAGQTKTRTFNSLRGVEASSEQAKEADFHPNYNIINGLQEIWPKTTHPAPATHSHLRYLFTSLLPYFLRRYPLHPHIRPQNLRHHNRPIRLLVILDNRDPRPPYRQP
jgi:hypothetical protein